MSPSNSASSPPENSSDNTNDEFNIDDKWMKMRVRYCEPSLSEVEIRECQIYKDEYKECTSFKGRFQQYFVYGQTIDCNQWKKDYNNCCKWRDDKDVKAAVTLIESEKARRLERLRAHYRNDIWKKREAPPMDWDKPLPEWIAKRDENTYLAMKAKDIREGKEEADSGFCSIM